MAATAPAAGAADACYDGKASYDVRGFWMPEGREWFGKTSSRCRDINIWPNATNYARICFYRSDASLLYCQDGTKKAEAGKWTVLAFNVQDSQLFKINFPSSDPDTRHTGAFAA
ncbi:hypothetical protein [Streptomyces sp. IB2014 016-6]|uniref:hypothetical protein n=1 Tax=Streptomyces sp. IB2014 016-6 TaxID=2517818 RepID=UPI0011CACC01|nr:hypothetical protein [Streptomyces sp. IB2014 016-6]TXL88059.1 hypothetical protein EW053_19555 [Streptomyces sp. IB2014 016-6]